MIRATIYVTQPGMQGVHDEVKRSLCANFGGYSEYNGNGGWVDGAGHLHTEQHIRYEVLVGRDTPITGGYNVIVNLIREVAQYVKAALNEQSVLFTIEAGVAVEFV